MYKANKFANILMPIANNLGNFQYVLIAIVGTYLTLEGYVTLVNIKNEDGKLVEISERTGMWAWKHPHHDGTIEYVELKGHIELKDIDFSYVEGKQILHDISMYAKRCKLIYRYDKGKYQIWQSKCHR